MNFYVVPTTCAKRRASTRTASAASSHEIGDRTVSTKFGTARRREGPTSRSRKARRPPADGRRGAGASRGHREGWRRSGRKPGAQHHFSSSKPRRAADDLDASVRARERSLLPMAEGHWAPPACSARKPPAWPRRRHVAEAARGARRCGRRPTHRSRRPHGSRAAFERGPGAVFSGPVVNPVIRSTTPSPRAWKTSRRDVGGSVGVPRLERFYLGPRQRPPDNALRPDQPGRIDAARGGPDGHGARRPGTPAARIRRIPEEGSRRGPGGMRPGYRPDGSGGTASQRLRTAGRARTTARRRTSSPLKTQKPAITLEEHRRSRRRRASPGRGPSRRSAPGHPGKKDKPGWATAFVIEDDTVPVAPSPRRTCAVELPREPGEDPAYHRPARAVFPRDGR